MRTPAILLASLLALATRAPAQSPGTVELSLFGNYSWYDPDLRVEDQFGGGGSLALYFLPHIALEVEGLYVPTSTSVLNQDVNNFPPRARITASIPLGGYASAFQIGAGYVRSVYREALTYEDNGITGLAGFRLGLSEHFAFRFNGTLDYAPDPQANLDSYTNYGVQAGISFLFGNRYDKDHDKISDKRDKCPSTSRDAEVDSLGCAATQRDSDRDGLADASDQCPTTGSGQNVDAKGCSAEQRDTDADKVADASDKCPSTPSGEGVNETGCAASQVDTDSDGVMDLADRCANTDRGPSVDEEGCSPAQKDGDKDGVMDVADRCTTSPAGQPVDANGCPADADGDGIADASDKCGSTPSGKEVDEFGCTRLFPGASRALVLYGAQFETGKATLTPGSEAALKEVAEALSAHPDVKVEVAGFTDATGSRATNMRISRQRAEAVMNYLVQNGANQAQVTAKGYGPSNPMASNKTAEGRAQNRRVELRRVVD